MKYLACICLYLELLAGLIHISAQAATHTDASHRIQDALRNKDYAAALDLARIALKTNPKQARVLAMEGIAYLNLGQQRDALEAFRRALHIDPTYLAALEGAAQIDFNDGSPEAVDLLDRIIRLRPDDPTSHAMLAVIAYRKADCTSAIRHFAMAVEAISAQPAALTEYASCLVDQGLAQSAIPLAQQAFLLDRDNPHLRYNLAITQQAAGKNAEALETLRPVLDADTPDPDALDLAAIAYDALDETPEAVRLLRMALIASPNEIRYYLDFTALALRHSSWDVGLDIVNLGLRKLPNSAQLYVARGILHVQISDFAAAHGDFATANRIDPAQTGGAVAQALADIQQHDPAKALASIDTQARQHPQDAFLQYLKALAYQKSGITPGSADYDRALEAARIAAHSENGFTAAHDLLAELDIEAGQFEEAEAESRLALQQNPSDDKAVYFLIRALRASGRDSHGELPTLTRQMAQLLAAKRNNETTENRFRLYEPDNANGPHKHEDTNTQSTGTIPTNQH